MVLTQEAIKAKKKSTSELISAVKRTERVLAHFSSVSEALKKCAFEVDELNEQNNVRLAVAASMLDRVENLLNPDEPIDEFLFDRVNQFVDQCQQELTSALDSALLITQPRTRIQVDIASGRIVDSSGWTLNSGSTIPSKLRHILLLRHVVFSAMRHDRMSKAADKKKDLAKNTILASSIEHDLHNTSPHLTTAAFEKAGALPSSRDSERPNVEIGYKSDQQSPTAIASSYIGIKEESPATTTPASHQAVSMLPKLTVKLEKRKSLHRFMPSHCSETIGSDENPGENVTLGTPAAMLTSSGDKSINGSDQRACYDRNHSNKPHNSRSQVRLDLLGRESMQWRERLQRLEAGTSYRDRSQGSSRSDRREKERDAHVKERQVLLLLIS